MRRFSLLLPKHGGIYENGWDLGHEDIWYGQAVFARSDAGLDKFGRVNLADYCFVFPEVKIKSFEVPNIEIFDHLPLILDFEI